MPKWQSRLWQVSVILGFFAADIVWRVTRPVSGTQSTLLSKWDAVIFFSGYTVSLRINFDLILGIGYIGTGYIQKSIGWGKIGYQMIPLQLSCWVSEVSKPWHSAGRWVEWLGGWKFSWIFREVLRENGLVLCWGFIAWLVDYWIWNLRNCHWKVRDMPVPLREGKERDLAAGQLSQMARIVLFLRCKMAVPWMWSHGAWTYKMTHWSWTQNSKVVMLIWLSTDFPTFRAL